MAVAGDGGSGKSTLIDELIQHFLEAFPSKKIAILANDPTTSTGRVATAFLADRVRMNHIYDDRVWLRSVATGSVYAPVSPALPHLLRMFRAAGFNLVLVETPGTGQTGIDLRALKADLLVYVKTREYGGGLQLQKDQLLRDAGLVVLNKADLEGAEAAFGEMRAVLAELGKEDVLVPDHRQGHPRPGHRQPVRRNLPETRLAGPGHPRKSPTFSTTPNITSWYRTGGAPTWRKSPTRSGLTTAGPATSCIRSGKMQVISPALTLPAPGCWNSGPGSGRSFPCRPAAARE